MWRGEAVITANPAPLVLIKVGWLVGWLVLNLDEFEFSSADEQEGCLSCYCSGVTDECSDARCCLFD